jgi:hypothetical protein
MSISFLNLDLDAFLDRVVHWVSGDERREADSYKPWSEAELRAFLENQCHLSPSHRVPGRFVVHHDRAFDFWKELVARHRAQIDLVHVDAHADLGLGDASWVHVADRAVGGVSQKRTHANRRNGATWPISIDGAAGAGLRSVAVCSEARGSASLLMTAKPRLRG